MSPRVARVADLGQAEAALARGREDRVEVVLVSAAEVTAFAGAGYWRALEEAVRHPIVVDCGDDPGLAMAALRAGCRDLLFTGTTEIAGKLEGMAAQLDARLRRRLEDA